MELVQRCAALEHQGLAKLLVRADRAQDQIEDIFLLHEAQVELAPRSHAPQFVATDHQNSIQPSNCSGFTFKRRRQARS